MFYLTDGKSLENTYVFWKKANDYILIYRHKLLKLCSDRFFSIVRKNNLMIFTGTQDDLEKLIYGN